MNSDSFADKTRRVKESFPINLASHLLIIIYSLSIYSCTFHLCSLSLSLSLFDLSLLSPHFFPSTIFSECVHVYCGYHVCSAARHPISATLILKLEKFTARNLSPSQNTIAIDYPRDDFRRSERRLVSRSRYQFPFRDSIQHGRAFPSACCISQGNGNRFEERCCETADGNTPSACMSPSAIGSSLWCPIPTDQPLAPFFRHPDLLNACFFTVHEISLQRHVWCVVAFFLSQHPAIESFRLPDERREKSQTEWRKLSNGYDRILSDIKFYSTLLRI